MHIRYIERTDEVGYTSHPYSDLLVTATGLYGQYTPLAEFLCNKFTDKKCSSLCQYKDIVLPFQKLCDIFVFLNIGWLERMLQA